MTNLISATEAKQNAEAFDLTCDQMIAQIANLIEANSKAGTRFVVAGFLKSAVTAQELDKAIELIAAKGYLVDSAVTSPESRAIRISW